MVPPFGPWDIAGIILFLLFSGGYHMAYHMYSHYHPLATVKGKIHLYRRTWVKRLLDRRDFIMGVQAIRNLIMTANLMATSAILVIGVILNILVSGNLNESFHPTGQPDPLIFWKLVALLFVFAFSFFSFLISVRYLNQLTILIGADMDLVEHVEGVDGITYLTMMLNRATNRYTYGQRGYYFAIAIVAWIFSDVAFVLATLFIGIFLVGVLDFQQWRPPRALRKQAEDLV